MGQAGLLIMVLGLPSLSIIIELCPGLIVAIFHCPRGRARHNDRLCSAAEQAQMHNVKAARYTSAAKAADGWGKIHKSSHK